jgi:conjugal transfer pilus assembly protein TraV
MCTACNPYNSEFKCKNAPFGTCEGTPDTYIDSLLATQGKDTKAPVLHHYTSPEMITTTGTGVKETAYLEAEMSKVTKLLKQPTTPVVLPPVVMRVLFLPYQGDDGELNMPSYTYVMLDKPKWVMGDYLIRQQGDTSNAW